MKRFAPILLAAALSATIAVAPAHADFGFEDFDVTFTNGDGSVVTQAGSHPFAMTTSLHFNTRIDPYLGEIPDEAVKDLNVAQIVGFVGNQAALPRCSTLAFLADPPNTACPDNTAVGETDLTLGDANGDPLPFAVYNLDPPPGVAAKLGFWALSVPVTIEVGLNDDPPYNLVARLTNIPQTVPTYAAKLTLWGVPADPAHDTERGHCVGPGGPSCFGEFAVKQPFLTVPRACAGPLTTSYEADSWVNPGAFVFGEALTHDGAVPPNPFGFIGCGNLGFSASIAAQPTTKAATSPTGLDFSLDPNDEGLKNPEGLADSDIRQAVVTLPEGMSTNPSVAEGLNVCTEAELARETAFSEAGTGCPNASKIGSVEAESPLVDEAIKGSLFVAKPYENEFDSLLALYMVIKNPNLGIVVKQALKVETNPVTGRITTVAENLPQLPFSHFRLHFREGVRSPLASPPACGTYSVKAELTPWSGTAPITTTSAFQIISGADNAPCPTHGTPPFHPGLIAGSINNAAGHYSPFNVRLFRSDSEQEITHFSIKLPPGTVGKLAGVHFCSDGQIAAAKARTGPHGGAEELASPSCPTASSIGHTLVGSGIGPSLTYVPGKLYLAGRYHGSPLSIVAITAAQVGPFDLGTVVVREALKINPETAEVFIDASGSDPIPHIIQGIPVHLRDIRAYADRPEFVLNPTSCARTSTASTVLGSGLNFASEADDVPVTVSTPFQAADCASLGFKPALSLSLRGATKRGAHPALRAVLRPRPGDANSRSISVQLPHSEFLEQSHINTVCTRVQFNAGAGNGAQCPAGSIYGHARAFTPILAEPLTGPVFLRSSEHPLPDLVLALHGLIDIDAVGRIDSVKGGIRNTFDFVPDAPISKVVVDFKGGNKGLLVNSSDICHGKHRAIAKFTGHNGKTYELAPKLKAKCGRKGNKSKRDGKASSRQRTAR
jgi:hypothetical protein